MMIKILILGIVLYVLYRLFFNKKNRIDSDTKQIEEELADCPTCGTYISKDEAILSNGKYYCSEKCLQK